MPDPASPPLTAESEALLWEVYPALPSMHQRGALAVRLAEIEIAVERRALAAHEAALLADPPPYDLAMQQLERAADRERELVDAMEMAWGIIANAGGGDWTHETDDWRTAAARWRDAYHEWLADPYRRNAEGATKGPSRWCGRWPRQRLGTAQSAARMPTGGSRNSSPPIPPWPRSSPM